MPPVEYLWGICSYFTDCVYQALCSCHTQRSQRIYQSLERTNRESFHLAFLLLLSQQFSKFHTNTHPWPESPFIYTQAVLELILIYISCWVLGGGHLVFRFQDAVLRDSVVRLQSTEEGKTCGGSGCTGKFIIHIISLYTWEMTRCFVRTVWAVLARRYPRLRACSLHSQLHSGLLLDILQLSCHLWIPRSRISLLFKEAFGALSVEDPQ